jgi:hypothetical protein
MRHPAPRSPRTRHTARGARTAGPLPFALALLLAACTGTVEAIHDGEPTPDGPPRAPRPGAQTPPPGERPGSGGAPGSPGVPASGGGGAPAAVTGTAFSCDPAAPLRPDRLRRLTGAQYRNVVRDLARLAARDTATAMELLGELNPVLARFPEDDRAITAEDPHGSYRRLAQDVQDAMVEAAYDVGAAFGRALAAPARLRKALADCGADPLKAPAGECLDRFLGVFGERALRRPLTAADRSFLRGVHGNAATIDPAGFAEVVTVLLSMPDVLYLVESGEAAVAGRKGLYTLSPYELAARLSLHFWQTIPDDELWQAAKTGALATPAGYERQVDRLFADTRTRATMDEFFREWLKVEDVPAVDALASDPAFKAFAGKDLPGRTLREAMTADLLDFVRHHTWTTAGTVKDLFTSELSFAKSPDLANIYGVPVWTGGEPPRFSPPNSRPGLLTRAGLLSSGLVTTLPITKGVYIRRNLLCDVIPPPPEGASQTKPEETGLVTTRKLVESLTEAPGSPCASCHSTFINPLGFATEDFDALGRRRTEEIFYTPKGAVAGKAPVDTRAVPEVVTGDKTPASGAAELARLMLDSGKPQACLARHYFRFTFGRPEEVASDGCALEALRRKLVDGGSLRDLLRQVALEPSFKQRVLD